MKILFVENHARFAQVVVKHFLAAHQVITVASIMQAKEALVSEAFDLILLDYDLDDGKGTELIPQLHTLTPRPFIIAASAHDKGNRALLNVGADEACRKTDFARIETVLLALQQRPTPFS